MLFHIITYISWCLGGLLCWVFHQRGYGTAKKLNRPVCKYEVLTIPTEKDALTPVSIEYLRPGGKFLARSIEKHGLVLCEGQTDASYQVIIRNTVDGWRNVYGWDGAYWAKFDDRTDTLIGRVSLSDPNFHDEIVRLQDEAQNKAAIMETIAS